MRSGFFSLESFWACLLERTLTSYQVLASNLWISVFPGRLLPQIFTLNFCLAWLLSPPITHTPEVLEVDGAQGCLLCLWVVPAARLLLCRAISLVLPGSLSLFLSVVHAFPRSIPSFNCITFRWDSLRLEWDNFESFYVWKEFYSSLILF